MHIHILGICGTFMGSLAQLAKAQGLKVTGCDANVYPPMSTQLEQAGIGLIEGFDAAQLDLGADLYVIGNAMSRGNPLVEAILNQRLPYTSGPAFLADHVLYNRWVLAAAGTHGKTTTSSMLAWILEYAGYQPGFLIGGVPLDFGVSARLGKSDFFVIEADEYDSAFFDKRSKFIHYRSQTVILNNLEYDHADIFDSIDDIKKQFHHLVRTVPAIGKVIYPADEQHLVDVINKGCWTPVETLSTSTTDANWRANLLAEDGSSFEVLLSGDCVGSVNWAHTGRHNVSNGLAAIAAARHVGVTPDIACAALCQFQGVKRRMEKLAEVDGVTVYDDFAHHPTAIATTLAGLRKQVGQGRIVAVIEPRSATMRLGAHQQALPQACADADEVIWFQNPTIQWDVQAMVDNAVVTSKKADSIEQLIAVTIDAASDGPTHIVVMSNGGFGGFHLKLIDALKAREAVQ